MSEDAAGKPHRSGVVALLGRTNAGKSTLLNRLLGEQLAIVTAKPQTTRSRILGVLTRPGAQLLFLDTPGFHRGGKALNRALHAQVEEAIEDCDVALLLVDPAQGWDGELAELFDRLAARSTPVVLVATKTDLTDQATTPWPAATERRAAASRRISARSGAGVEALVEAVVPLLPEGPRYFDEDTLTDRTLRFLVAERIREAAFEALGQELPYALAVQIEEFDESREDLTRIRARILVERESQKPMVIGRGGTMVKRIGTRARKAIEAQLGTRVHLELRVKTDPRWAKDANRLKSLGYH